MLESAYQKEIFEAGIIDEITGKIMLDEIIFNENSIQKALQEDVNLNYPSNALWRIRESEPDIKQIYGHFLPPIHRNLVEGLVAKDFNFPAAYHAADDLERLLKFYDTSFELEPDSVISLKPSVKIRIEDKGAVIYTQYFNGYWINESALNIIKCCEAEISVLEIASRSNHQYEIVKEFLTRALILGLIDAKIS